MLLPRTTFTKDISFPREFGWSQTSGERKEERRNFLVEVLFCNLFLFSRRFNLINRLILHDPDSYANPLEFNPERFLGDHPEPDPRGAAFGYGRRICECFRLVSYQPPHLGSEGALLDSPSSSPND